MKAIDKAILRTISYADIFDYPLTKEEIHQWLIIDRFRTPRASSEPLSSLGSKPFIEKTKNFFHLPGRQSIVNLRLKRQRFSQQKLIKAQQITNLLKHIPTINLIALTGALAMNNSDESDDIDLMIITKPNRLWLTRLLAIIILELFHLRRRPQQKHSVPERNTNKACLNLFLDESSLVIPISRRNLYTAHEVAQIKPLFDRAETYQKFFALNTWVKDYLPNKVQNLNGSKLTPRMRGSELSVRVPNLLFLNILNSLTYKLQHWYMKSKLTREKISLHSAFFHPRPTGKLVLAKYHQRLQSIGSELQIRSEPKKKVTILVTGVFDILHREHKKFLYQAKKQGDILLVGLESDERVKKLKGPARPINPLHSRIENLEKWGIADQVFALPKKFDSDQDHLDLLQKIKPDILAVSSHTPNLQAKSRLMQSIGGTVKIVHPHNPKISVTKILKKTSSI